MIDWVLGSIIFCQLSHHDSKMSPSAETLLSLVIPPAVVEILLTLKFLDTPVPEIPQSILPAEPWKLQRVTLINAAAYTHAVKLKGSQCFQLHISSPKTRGHSATTSDIPVDLSTIPKDYHDFQDVFSKSKASKLADHRPYDLKITLDEGTSPPFGPIYSLSQEELAALCKFIDENLTTGFICPSHSLCGAPVLFIWKKDGSLQLCIDFWGLNHISKKDRYPLPLISNLLDTLRKARAYTKIDLWHAYHLV